MDGKAKSIPNNADITLQQNLLYQRSTFHLLTSNSTKQVIYFSLSVPA